MNMQHVAITIAGTVRPVYASGVSGLTVDCSTLSADDFVKLYLPAITDSETGSPLTILTSGAVVEVWPSDVPVGGKISPFRMSGESVLSLFPVRKGSGFCFINCHQEGTIAYRAPIFPSLYWDDTVIIDDFNVWAEELPFIIA